MVDNFQRPDAHVHHGLRWFYHWQNMAYRVSEPRLKMMTHFSTSGRELGPILARPVAGKCPSRPVTLSVSYFSLLVRISSAKRRRYIRAASRPVARYSRRDRPRQKPRSASTDLTHAYWHQIFKLNRWPDVCSTVVLKTSLIVRAICELRRPHTALSASPKCRGTESSGLYGRAGNGRRSLQFPRHSKETRGANPQVEGNGHRNHEYKRPWVVIVAADGIVVIGRAVLGASACTLLVFRRRVPDAANKKAGRWQIRNRGGAMPVKPQIKPNCWARFVLIGENVSLWFLGPVYTCDFSCDFDAILVRFCIQNLPQPTPQGFLVA